MINDPLPRLDRRADLRRRLLPYCRLQPGEIWADPVAGHRVGCLDAADGAHVAALMAGQRARLAVQDPPYNLAAFERRSLPAYIDWCRAWVLHSWALLDDDAALYVWMGADQNDQFRPLPDFMLMMRETSFRARSLITLRNQRGYGTLGNWMAVRQELLYYVKGEPPFNVQYTAIPKAVNGYYKVVDGRRLDNRARSRSPFQRPGNVWVDVQQVFYRMEENVSGCYAQKPLQAIERIVAAGSAVGELVVDLFSHAGTTLLACERLGRRCFTADCDPVYCELTIRRLEHFRQTGRLGWQNGHAFTAEIGRLAARPASSA